MESPFSPAFYPGAKGASKQCAPRPARRAGGNSLDNTIRIDGRWPTGRLMRDIQVHAVHAGHGHGRMHLWSENGASLAAASLSVTVRIHNETPTG